MEQDRKSPGLGVAAGVGLLAVALQAFVPHGASAAETIERLAEPPGPAAGATARPPDVPPPTPSEPEPPAASEEKPARQRFQEHVQVVAERPQDEQAPAELPVRPLEVMAVAGAADNVFRTLQTLPGVAPTNEFDSRISVRGGGPDENLTVMDGVEIHNPYRLYGLTSAFNPETVSAFELYAGAFSAKHGDRLSSLLVIENRQGTREHRFSGSSTMSLTDANVVLEGRLPGAGRRSWIVTGRRTYYDLVANSIVGTELPAFGDVQGRLDWELRPGTSVSFFGILSREAADASFEGDRPGEQGSFVSTTRNDLAALTFRTLLGQRVVSRTIGSFYVNRGDFDVDAQFRSDWRRSNAPSDETGFALASVSFVSGSEVRDLALRQELAITAGSHLVEAGFELHNLRTTTALEILGDRNPAAANGSSVQGGVGLPDQLDSELTAARTGAWLQDRWQAGARLSLEAGARLDWSGVNRRAVLAPRFAATLRLGRATRLRAAGGLFAQSPGYEKLVQSDYFADLSGEIGRSLRYERATHAVLGLERDLPGTVSARVEAYWKGFHDLLIGRLESEPERLARLARYDFPAELASSIPAEAIITTIPENAGSGRAWGIDVLLQKRARAGARISGWASYSYGVAERTEYGRTLPFDYDRRHAASLVGSWRISSRWQLGATLRAFSGFPRTPVLGLRVSSEQTPDGRLVPARDSEGRYVYEADSGGVANLNAARLPAFGRLDLRLSWKPRGDAGRWLLYLDLINATNRKNAGSISTRLEYDPSSALDRPRLALERTGNIPLLPSFGVRFRF